MPRTDPDVGASSAIFDWTDDENRLSSNQLLQLVTGTDAVLHVQRVSDDLRVRFFQLHFNALLVEFRDVFRMLHGMREKLHSDTLTDADAQIFFKWFDGFDAMLTAIFAAEEHVLFPMMENFGVARLPQALTTKRRRAHTKETEQHCSALRQQKPHLDRKGERKPTLSDMVSELSRLAQDMASQVLSYAQTLMTELPDVLETNLRYKELRLLLDAWMENYRSSESGKLVLCAFSRGIVGATEKNAFLDKSLRTPTSAKATVPKQMRKYRKTHSDLVALLTNCELVIETKD